MCSRNFAAFLFESLVTAKLNARSPFRFRFTHPGALQVRRPVLDMRAKLLFHFTFHLGAMEKTGNKRTKGMQKTHTSSGRAFNAEPIAAARRFHPSSSSRKRLRPPAVNS